jgi:hypothetical protein
MDDIDKMVPCPICGVETHAVRLEMGYNCINCTNERPYLGNVEGVAKQGSLLMAKAGSEEARRMFNGGTAIIRRNSPASVRVRKGGHA